jgi:hypothetical protein
MLKDTTPAARKMQLEALASRPASDRLREALELSDFVHELAAAGERKRREAREPTRPAGSEA